METLNRESMKTLVFLSWIVYSGAVLQSVTFHTSFVDGEGDSYTFRSHVPDSSIFPIQRIVRFCTGGGSRWMFTDYPNYSGSLYLFGELATVCYNRSVSEFRSFRYLGNLNTEVEGVSLYPATFVRGLPEVAANHSPFGCITQYAVSLAHTGKSSWTLFEGSNFEGKTACLPGKSSVFPTLYYNVSESFQLNTVGSLVRGCQTTSELLQVAPQRITNGLVN